MTNKAENQGSQLNTEAVDDLKNENAKLQHELEMANAKIKWYEEQLRLNAAKKYGKSSDTVDEAQISFFDEAEITARVELEEPALEKITYERSRKRGTNKPSFEDLPVERIEYDIPENGQVCEKCDSRMHEMSVEVRKELKMHTCKGMHRRTCQEVIRMQRVPKIIRQNPYNHSSNAGACDFRELCFAQLDCIPYVPKVRSGTSTHQAGADV